MNRAVAAAAEEVLQMQIAWRDEMVKLIAQAEAQTNNALTLARARTQPQAVLSAAQLPSPITFVECEIETVDASTAAAEERREYARQCEAAAAEYATMERMLAADDNTKWIETQHTVFYTYDQIH